MDDHRHASGDGDEISTAAYGFGEGEAQVGDMIVEGLQREHGHPLLPAFPTGLVGVEAVLAGVTVALGGSSATCVGKADRLSRHRLAATLLTTTGDRLAALGFGARLRSVFHR